jgi:hypothetical protein
MRLTPPLLAFAFCALLPMARAQSVVFPNFSGSPAGLTLRSVTSSGGVLTLADSTNDRGSVFTSSQFSVAGFSTVFEFRILNPGGSSDGSGQQGADGLAFVIQRAAGNSLGSNGEGLGYIGINNSVAVEFDTWLNSSRSDPDSNHYGLNLNGSGNSVVTAPEANRFDNGQKWTAWVDYDGTTIEVRTSLTGVRPSAAVLSYGTAQNPFSLASTIGGGTAFIGFTAATGSATGTHQLLGFAFSDTYLAGGLAAVPEPSTWALLILGLGAVAVAGWRRRRS